MKIRTALLLMALSASLWAAEPKPVTLVVDEVPVVQVLQALATQENRNLVVSPDVNGSLSLSLTRVPWRKALQTVVNSAGLVLREEGGIFYVHTAAWQQAQQTRKTQEQAQRQLDAPLLSHGISFSYADAGELQKAAEKLLSPKGSLSVDKRTNRLLVRDNQTVLDTLVRWAEQMDLPIDQVELAAHIVTINEKSLRELGVKWNLAEASEAGRVGQVTALGADLSVANATTHVGFNIGRIDGRLLDLELSALEQKQQVDIIASPRLLASHMQPASSRAVRSPIRFPAVKAGQRRWSLKRRCSAWRSRQWYCREDACGSNYTSAKICQGRCCSRLMAKRWLSINRRLKLRLRSKAVKPWRWAAFSRKKIKPAAIACRGWGASPGLDNFFAMTGRITSGGSW